MNIKGVLYGNAAALPHMQRQRSGHIIDVSSVAGHKIPPGAAVYAAAKPAVRALFGELRQLSYMTEMNMDKDQYELINV